MVKNHSECLIWFFFNIAYCSKSNRVYVICTNSDSSCQYLDLNNQLSERKEVSSPKTNEISSLLMHDKSAIPLSNWDGLIPLERELFISMIPL